MEGGFDGVQKSPERERADEVYENFQRQKEAVQSYLLRIDAGMPTPTSWDDAGLQKLLKEAGAEYEDEDPESTGDRRVYAVYRDGPKGKQFIFRTVPAADIKSLLEFLRKGFQYTYSKKEVAEMREKLAAEIIESSSIEEVRNVIFDEHVRAAIEARKGVILDIPKGTPLVRPNEIYNTLRGIFGNDSVVRHVESGTLAITQRSETQGVREFTLAHGRILPFLHGLVETYKKLQELNSNNSEPAVNAQEAQSPVGTDVLNERETGNTEEISPRGEASKMTEADGQIVREYLQSLSTLDVSPYAWNNKDLENAIKAGGFVLVEDKSSSADPSFGKRTYKAPDGALLTSVTPAHMVNALREELNLSRVQEKGEVRAKRETPNEAVVPHEEVPAMPRTMDEGESKIEPKVPDLSLEELEERYTVKPQSALVEELAALAGSAHEEEKSFDDGIPVLTDVVDVDALHAAEAAKRVKKIEAALQAALAREEVLGTEENGGEDPRIPTLTDRVAEGAPQAETREVVAADTEAETPSANEALRERVKNFAEMRREVDTDVEDIAEVAPGSVAPAPDELFEKNLGITAEHLESIPGYAKLSPEQQTLVYENLVAYAARGKGTFLEKTWAGIQLAFGDEGDRVPAQGSRGMAAYGNVLTQLVASMERFGPKVHREEDGVLVPDLVSMRFDRAHRKEQYEAVRTLNLAAHELAHTPAAWLEDGIGTHTGKESKITTFFKEKLLGGLSEKRARYNEYQNIQHTYEEAKRDLVVALRESGVGEGEVAKKLIEIDARVYQLQFMQTNPDAVEAVQGIDDVRSWQEVGKSLVSKSGIGYIALGAVARQATAGMLGFLSGPAVASTIAGTRSWNRTAAELREKDRQARVGKGDASMEALNIVPASRMVEVNGEQRDFGLIQKTQALINRFYGLGEGEDAERERNKVLDELKNRVEYIQDKQKLNRINYGSREEYVINQTKLFEVLGEAAVIVADNHKMPKSALSVRLEQYVQYREESIEGRRRRVQMKKLVIPVTKAAAFSLAGAFAADYVRSSELPKSVQNFLDRTPETPVKSVETPLNLSADEAASALEGSAGDAVASEALTTTEAVSPLGPYTIERGDTLIGIMEEKVPALRALGESPARENAIANILNALSPEELERIGVGSGDVDMIYAGESVNLEELNKIVGEKQEFIDSALERFGVAASETAPKLEVSPLPESPAEPSTVSASSTEITPPSEAVRIDAATGATVLAAGAGLAMTELGLTVDQGIRESSAARQKNIKEFLTPPNMTEVQWTQIRNFPVRNVSALTPDAINSRIQSYPILEKLSAIRAALDKAGIKVTLTGKETVGQYLDRVSKIAATRADTETYTKILSIIQPKKPTTQ